MIRGLAQIFRECFIPLILSLENDLYYFAHCASAAFSRSDQV